MLKYIVKTVVLFVIFLYLAYTVKKTISNINAGQIIKVTDNNVVYKNIVNNNDIYSQLSDLFFYTVICIGIAVIALSHGIETTSILTILGSIGLALALSAQNLLGNVLCGIKIAFSNTLKIGDVVDLKIRNMPATTIIKGKVTDINLFTTKIALVNTNEQMIIPNATIENCIIINSSIVYT